MQELQYLCKFEKDIEILKDFNRFISYNKNEISNTFGKVKPKRFNPMLELSDDEFCKKYHFTKENMSKIIEMMGDDLDIDNSTNERKKSQVAGEIQVMIAIRAWALSEHPEITAAVHGVSYETLKKICKRVAAAFAMKASRFIRMPATLSEKEQVTSTFRALAAMPQIIGTVIHKTVRVIDEPGDHNAENTQGGYIYIQFTSDASLKIRDIDCKFQKHLKEQYFSKMFARSRIRERMEQNEFRGRYLLGNSQINNSNVLLTPLLLTRNEKEAAYNCAHRTTYRPAVSCMQMLSNRFGIIESDLHGSLNTARNTIITLALLHNLSIEWADTSIKISSKNYFSMPLSNHTIEYTKDCKVQNKIFQQDFIRNNF